jgi:hypothetical protein
MRENHNSGQEISTNARRCDGGTCQSSMGVLCITFCSSISPAMPLPSRGPHGHDHDFRQRWCVVRSSCGPAVTSENWVAAAAPKSSIHELPPFSEGNAFGNSPEDEGSTAEPYATGGSSCACGCVRHEEEDDWKMGNLRSRGFLAVETLGEKRRCFMGGSEGFAQEHLHGDVCQPLCDL